MIADDPADGDSDPRHLDPAGGHAGDSPRGTAGAPARYDVDGALEKVEAGDRYRGAWWRRVVKPGLKAPRTSTRRREGRANGDIPTGDKHD